MISFLYFLSEHYTRKTYFLMICQADFVFLKIN